MADLLEEANVLVSDEASGPCVKQVLQQIQDELKALGLLEPMQQELTAVRASQLKIEQWISRHGPRGPIRGAGPRRGHTNDYDHDDHHDHHHDDHHDHHHDRHHHDHHHHGRHHHDHHHGRHHDRHHDHHRDPHGAHANHHAPHGAHVLHHCGSNDDQNEPQVKTMPLAAHRRAPHNHRHDRGSTQDHGSVQKTHTGSILGAVNTAVVPTEPPSEDLGKSPSFTFQPTSSIVSVHDVPDVPSVPCDHDSEVEPDAPPLDEPVKTSPPTSPRHLSIAKERQSCLKPTAATTWRVRRSMDESDIIIKTPSQRSRKSPSTSTPLDISKPFDISHSLPSPGKSADMAEFQGNRPISPDLGFLAVQPPGLAVQPDAATAPDGRHSKVSCNSTSSKRSVRTLRSMRSMRSLKSTASRKSQHQKNLNHAMYADENGAKYLRQMVLRSAYNQGKKALSVRSSRLHGQAKARGRSFKAFILSPAFEVFSGLILLAHTLCIGAYVEHLASHGSKVHPALKVANQILVIVFVIEVVLKAWAERLEYITGHEAFWNCFDIVLVLMVVVEVIVDLAESANAGHSEHIKSLLKIGEVVRFARVLRIFRMLRFSNSLRVILSKIFNSMQTLFWVLVLIFLMLFVIAICITQGAANYLNDRENTHPEWRHLLESNYGSVAKSVLTLFKSVTGGTLWGPVVDCLVEISILYAGIFVSYIGFTIFAVLNLVTGVFVDAAVQTSSHERDLVSERQMKHDMKAAAHLRDIFFDMAESDDGYLDADQFTEYLQDEYVTSYMAALKIDTSDAAQLFRLLDGDNSGEILVDEFVEGCMKLRGEAKSMDIHIMICENRRMIARFCEFAELAEEQLDILVETAHSTGALVDIGITDSETDTSPTAAITSSELDHSMNSFRLPSAIHRQSEAQVIRNVLSPVAASPMDSDGEDERSMISGSDVNSLVGPLSTTAGTANQENQVVMDEAQKEPQKEAVPTAAREHPFGCSDDNMLG